METVVILGAGGRVGNAAARAFIARGWKVKGLARNAKADRLAPGVEPVRVDATDRQALIKACEGADVIVNALNPLYTEWAEKVLPMAQNVIVAAEAAGATHMLPGNVYNFGHSIGMGMKEDAAEVGSTEKARIRIEMEALFRRAAEEQGVQTIVLRAGDFYGGSQTGSWLDQMILSKLKSDSFVWPGPMDVPHAFAYLPDLGEAFVALAEKRRQLGRFECFHFEGHVLTGEQMKQASEEASGRKLKRRGVPWALLRAAGLFSPMMREIAVMSYLWRVPHSLDGLKLEKAVGLLPGTDPVEAIGRSIAALGLDPRKQIAA